MAHVYALTSCRSKLLVTPYKPAHTPFCQAQLSERRGWCILEEGYPEGSPDARAGFDLDLAKVTCNALRTCQSKPEE